MGRKKQKPLDTGKVFVYLRVSTEEQAVSGLGLEAQLAAVKLYCELNGLEIIDVFRDEGVSSTVPLAKRPAGAELLRRLKAREAGTVVTSKLDRMFRKTVEALHTLEQWDKAGVRTCFLNIGGLALDTATPTGKLMFTIMVAFAELERSMISERTTDALQAKRKRGESMGNIPFGYKSKLVDGINVLIEEEKEQQTIKLINELRFNDSLSVPKIRTRLNQSGILNRGKQWHLTSLYRLLNREPVICHKE